MGLNDELRPLAPNALMFRTFAGHAVEVPDLKEWDMLAWASPAALAAAGGDEWAAQPDHLEWIDRVEVDPDPNADKVTIHFKSGTSYVASLWAPEESEVGKAFALWNVMREVHEWWPEGRPPFM